MLLGALLILSAGASEGPTLEIALGTDWAIVEESPSELRLRHKRSADGLLVVFQPGDDGRAVGISPIRDGHTLELTQGDRRVPTFSWPYPEHALTAVRIEGQGPDLLVRLEGPPLSEVSTHPDAPPDPVLSWVRVRPRGETWRIALRGVHRWVLPAPRHSAHQGQTRTLETPWGSFEVRTDAPASRGHSDGAVRVWDTTPSIDAAQPYAQTGITWTPGVLSP